MLYAQIDDENKVVAVSHLSGEVNSPRLILITTYDETLLGKRYNHETGQFEAVE